MDLVAFAEELTGSKLLEGKEKEKRMVGLDQPVDALTMVGDVRLANLRWCIETVINEKINGDIIECGVWRGGACIYAKAVLNELGSQKKVFVADSFNGFPEPKWNWDKGANFLDDPTLKVSIDTVRENFKKYGLLDDRVIFIEGFFSATLPSLNETFSIVRADGDLFESTIDILMNTYEKLSVGGIVIIDDYALECCRQAVEQFRALNDITEPLVNIDQFAVYWRKQNGCNTSHN